MVSDSNNPFSLVGNFFVFVIAAGIVVAIGAGIGTLVAAATSSSKNQKVSDDNLLPISCSTFNNLFKSNGVCMRIAFGRRGRQFICRGFTAMDAFSAGLG